MSVLRLHRLYGSQSFKASCGWYRKFRKRNGITIRRTTHISQKPKDITDDLITRFQRQIIRSRLARGYKPCEIRNMDETPVWLEMPGNSALDYVGKKTIQLILLDITKRGLL